MNEYEQLKKAIKTEADPEERERLVRYLERNFDDWGNLLNTGSCWSDDNPYL